MTNKFANSHHVNGYLFFLQVRKEEDKHRQIKRDIETLQVSVVLFIYRTKDWCDASGLSFFLIMPVPL